MRRVLYGGAMATLAAGLFGLSQLYFIRRHVDILREQAGDMQSSIRALNVSVFESNLYIFCAFIGIIGIGLAYVSAFYKPLKSKRVMSAVSTMTGLYILSLIFLSAAHFFLAQ